MSIEAKPRLPRQIDPERDLWAEVAQLTAELETERKRLLVVIATAGIPIEAMFAAGSERWHSPELQQEFVEARAAIRAALAQRGARQGERSDG